MRTIKISREIGPDIRTRSFFRRDVERLASPLNEDTILDFINVEFISRSVADEICNLLEDYPLLSITGMIGDVRKMYTVVVEGRSKPRVYPEMKAEIYHLKNMKELSEFFCSL